MSARGTAPLSRRAFLGLVAERLPSHLPPRLRGFRSERWGRLYKLWYGDAKRVHFEAQFLRGGRLELGLHLEADPATNAALLRRLGPARALRALGRPAALFSHGPGWSALAETWPAAGLLTEEAATEAAARLACYVVTLGPLVGAPAPERARRPTSQPRTATPARARAARRSSSAAATSRAASASSRPAAASVTRTSSPSSKPRARDFT
jgi:hypothetical protein